MSAATSPHWANTGSVNCLAIGARLAEFEITGVVGEGGFGNVYLAFDHSLQRTVAIKEYMPVSLASRGPDQCIVVQSKRRRKTFEIGMNSFINEARLLAQFDHPALIKVYRFWEQNNTAYMAMRYYEGQTFKHIINRRPELVTEAWLKPILRPILEALEELHKIQILHRDISPENIMIQSNGDAVLLDFGAARQIIGDLSQALTVILKPAYAPVEQYAEDGEMKQGPWTDIYALSTVVYSAIVKKPPPTSITRMIKDQVELLQDSTIPNFSREFLAAIDKGMAVKPEDRPQSIAEFSKLLSIDQGKSIKRLPLAHSSPDRQKTAEGMRRPAYPQELKRTTGHSASLSSGRSTRKKVSVKGSWALIVAGMVLATGTGMYRWSHPTAVAHVAPAIPANTPVAGPPPAMPDPVAVAPQSKPPVGAPDAASKPKTEAGRPADAISATENDANPRSMAIFRLTIKPWATIMVDGGAKGISPPLKKLTLPDGRHRIRLINPNFPDHEIEIVANGKKRENSIDYDFSAH